MPLPADIERRISALEHRVDVIDQQGTRGIEGMRIQIANQTTDIVALDGRLNQIDQKLDSAARVRINQYIGFALALLPVYVLLFMAVFHVTPA